jgi:hypothetical protein
VLRAKLLSLPDEVMRLTAPLLPHDRTALLHALAVLLRSEPVQPPSDGIVHQHCRELLRTGSYRRQDWLVAAGGWHGSTPTKRIQTLFAPQAATRKC